MQRSTHGVGASDPGQSSGQCATTGTVHSATCAIPAGTNAGVVVAGFEESDDINNNNDHGGDVNVGGNVGDNGCGETDAGQLQSNFGNVGVQPGALAGHDGGADLFPNADSQQSRRNLS